MTESLSVQKNARITAAIERWQGSMPDRGLPWQSNRTPYSVWVSEIMLQQTQARTVIPYYQKFMRTFPGLQALAAAGTDEVLRHWSGLGYYSRARNLHRAAQQIATEHGGRMPEDLEALMALPGIGRSTAGAILAMGMDKRGVILDTNVKRVLSRLHAVEGQSNSSGWLKELWRLADSLTPQEAEKSAAHAQAMMDLGAIVCRPGEPACDLCPLAADCLARRKGRQQDFPGKKSKKARPVKAVQWLCILNSDGEMLLQKRPGTGLWGGLWTLPECPPDGQLIPLCRQWTGLEPDAIEHWKDIRHLLTHFELRAAVQLMRISTSDATATILQEQNASWFTPVQALSSLAMPTPVNRLLGELRSVRTA